MAFSGRASISRSKVEQIGTSANVLQKNAVPARAARRLLQSKNCARGEAQSVEQHVASNVASSCKREDGGARGCAVLPGLLRGQGRPMEGQNAEKSESAKTMIFSSSYYHRSDAAAVRISPRNA